MHMKLHMTIDILLIVGVILCLVVIMLGISYFRPDLGNKAVVQIKVDGQEFGTYSLHENQEIPVQTQYGYNLVVIENGSVYVKESDCSNQDCIQQGSMNLDNYTQRFLGNLILCLPHKMEIKLIQNP